jgi:Mor family transcriptional regulator
LQEKADMRPPGKTARNRGIYAAFQSGESVDQLAARHGLSKASIVSILNAEKNKMAVSPDPAYRALRGLAK